MCGKSIKNVLRARVNVSFIVQRFNFFPMYTLTREFCKAKEKNNIFLKCFK